MVTLIKVFQSVLGWLDVYFVYILLTYFELDPVDFLHIEGNEDHVNLKQKKENKQCYK